MRGKGKRMERKNGWNNRGGKEERGGEIENGIEFKKWIKCIKRKLWEMKKLGNWGDW